MAVGPIPSGPPRPQVIDSKTEKKKENEKREKKETHTWEDVPDILTEKRQIEAL